MKHTGNLLWVVILLTALVSCQKEFSEENGDPSPIDPGTPGTTGALLTRSVFKDDISSIEFLYTYNAAKQPVRMQTNSSILGFDLKTDARYTRNTDGRVTRMTYQFFYVQTAETINIDYTISRNASGRITHVLLVPNDPLAFYYDSLVYSYSSAGKMTRLINYFIDFDTRVALPGQRVDYTWSGDNVIKAEEYELDGSLTAATLVQVVDFEFDNRPAPIIITQDEYISNISGPVNFIPSVNNATKISRTYPDSPDENSVNRYRYTYRSDGKPSQAEITGTVGGTPITTGTQQFFYQ